MELWQYLVALNDALTVQADLPLNQSFLGALLGIGSAIGSLFGGAAKGRAEGREREAQIGALRDRNETDKYGIAQNAQFNQGSLDLQRKGFSEDARGNRAKQALIGDLIARFAPTQINVPGIQQAQVSGGLSLGEGGKQAASELVKQALLAQMTPDKFEGGNILKAPQATPLPQPNWLDKVLGIGGLIGSGMGAVAPFIPQGGGGPSPAVPQLPPVTQGLDPRLLNLENLR